MPVEEWVMELVLVLVTRGAARRGVGDGASSCVGH